MIVNQKQTLALPEALRAKFRALERRLFIAETIAVVALVTVSALAGYLGFFAVERVLDSPKWLRLIFALAVFCGMAWAILYWATRWVIARRDLRQLAILVQNKHRRLGDRLLGIVELSDEHKRPDYFSPELYAAAIQQVARDAEPVDFQQAVNPGAVQRALIASALLGILSIGTALFAPPVANNSLRRLFAPLSSLARRTLVHLETASHEMVVARGESFRVPVRVQYESFWHPKTLRLFYGGLPSVTTSITNDIALVQVPGQIAAAPLDLKLGDSSARIKIEPLDRPALRGLQAHVDLPAYLQYPSAEQAINSSSISLVDGSAVTFHGTAIRPLKVAEMNDNAKPISLKTVGTDFQTTPIAVDGVRDLAFTWSDQFGLTNAAPWPLTVQNIPDAAPSADFSDLFRDIAILETEVLQIKAAASDDFGIKELGVDLQIAGSNTVTSAAPFRTQATNATTRQLEQSFVFTPTVLGIGRDSSIEMRAWTLDYFPGRGRSESPVYRVHVLGIEQHAEMLRQRMESLLAQLDEVSRLEEKITAATRAQQESNKPADEAAAKKIEDLKEQQNQNAADLKKMADEGAKTVREATRNPAFTPEMIAEWSKTLSQMSKVSQSEMKQAAHSLQAAQKQEKREENLANAAQKEEEALKALQELQKKVNKELDDMQALTLAQRLRELGTHQTEIAADLRKSVSDTIGLAPRELPPGLAKENSDLATKQAAASEHAHGLQTEISRFFERTGKTNYAHVSKEMEAAHTVDELDHVKSMIAENIAMDASQQLTLWSAKFQAWADFLEPKPSGDSGSSGSESGGSPQDAAMKQLVALLRMREAQTNIRERTRLTDEQRKDADAYKSSVGKLHQGQQDLHHQIGKVAEENRFKELKQPLEQAEEEIGFAENLLHQPRTDARTVEIEGNAIDNLSDAINLLNEHAGKGSKGQSSSSSEEMAFLMQMMKPQNSPGMTPGKSPGGNMAGGSTDQIPGSLRGGANGQVGESRTGSKASGVGVNVPTEFREALEGYYKALERQGTGK